jgi:predicted RNase H-like nuclease
MAYRKKIEAGVNERLDLLRPVFPEIDCHLQDCPSGVGKDDLLDAAAAAWTALRLWKGQARRICGTGLWREVLGTRSAAG